VRESVIIVDHPPLHVTGPVARGPIILAMSDLPLKLRVFQLESEVHILELLLLCPQPLLSQMRR
jgi:hypothetical protein